MGKKRLIAETGAGQHGVATATIAARLGLECQVFMGEEDIRRQALNVYRMTLAWRRGGLGHVRLENAERRYERSHAGLGDQRRRYLLHYRHSCRAASIPHARA